MTTKYYVSLDGSYIGGFGDGAVPPLGSIEVRSPPENARQLWVGGAWQAYVNTQEEQEANRKLAFVSEADPLFFKWQAGEATQEEWLAKRQEIRDRYPDPLE